MTPEERAEKEQQIKESFDKEKQELESLKQQVLSETDETEKERKNTEIQRLENELAEIGELIDSLNWLQEEELNALKVKLEEVNDAITGFKWEASDIIEELESKKRTITYDLLKESEESMPDWTYKRLRDIITNNPDEFKNIPGENAEKKLEYIFEKVHSSIILFLKNKFWDSEKNEEVIDYTIAPALEWNLMELLRDQWNETNIWMLQNLDKINRDSLWQLFRWVKHFAKREDGSYWTFESWMNALDYLAVHNWVLHNPKQSEVLSNPLKFQEYLNNNLFTNAAFSPYMTITPEQRKELFKIDENQNFSFGISETEKQTVLQNIWDIKVANNPKTTALIAKLIEKPEQILEKTDGLQATANHLLDSVESISSVTKIFWVDILWEVTKAPAERGFLYKVLDFVCKLIWITWWLEWIVKNWRRERLWLTDEKNDNIYSIIWEYKHIMNETEEKTVSITDQSSCTTVLSEFAVSDLDKPSTTRWDKLRDAIAENVDISLINPTVVNECLWAWYLKKETKTENWKQVETTVVDESKFTADDKKKLAHQHLIKMRQYFTDTGNFNNLKDFYSQISKIDDLSVCITAALYADKNDVVEWLKAKVFLPENYGVALNGEESHSDIYQWTWRDVLDATESAEKNTVNEQYIYDKAVEYWITDNRQIAYVLATVKGECWFKNIAEIWLGQWHDYWIPDSVTWKTYYGRGFIQLTWKYNYEKYTQIIRASWLDFKDNEGNVIKWNEIDLVNNPDIILMSNDLAVFILVDWMKNGWPDRVNTKKLDYYFNSDKEDFYNARSIISWMSSDPWKYQSYAKDYLNKLQQPDHSSIEDSEVWEVLNLPDILIWPRLDASTKNELWWLGNSIMCGFQWYQNKTNFPNMDWIEWKSTRTHQGRFKSQNDVHKYVTDNPNIKSFMFYFWANTQNNWQTLNDIKQRSEWLEAEWIQPVLCTCIWEDRHTWLTELNTNLKSLWQEKNRPVFDFASLYNDDKISMWWDHPNWTWYDTMAWCINKALSD